MQKKIQVPDSFWMRLIATPPSNTSPVSYDAQSSYVLTGLFLVLMFRATQDCWPHQPFFNLTLLVFQILHRSVLIQTPPLEHVHHFDNTKIKFWRRWALVDLHNRWMQKSRKSFPNNLIWDNLVRSSLMHYLKLKLSANRSETPFNCFLFTTDKIEWLGSVETKRTLVWGSKLLTLFIRLPNNGFLYTEDNNMKAHRAGILCQRGEFLKRFWLMIL